ncbi:MAG TPA: PepSY-associated TM helix domain-containing protein [Micropepsaceae bacterium]|nr:PepSY-associated TM helix domain-containing protein [Micropepsaceae bacterium]
MGWRQFRKWLQLVHLWAGLSLGIPIIVIGLTGSLIVAQDWYSELSVPSAAARGQVQPIANIVTAAQKFAPAGWPVTVVNMPTHVGMAAAVQLGLPPGRRPRGGRNLQGMTLFLDPVSLKFLGSQERRRQSQANQNLRSLHIALMVPQYYGVQIVGFLGIAMTLFGLSGLALWWPRNGQWRSAFMLKRGLRGFRLNRDLHSVTGFWSLLVFLVVCISGVDLAFPVTFQSTVGRILQLNYTLTSATVDPATAASIVDRNALTPDEATRVATASVPHARVVQVQLPPRPDGVYMVTMVPRIAGDSAPQISTFIGPGPEVLDVVDPRNYSPGKQMLVWLRVLHYGQGLGDIWRALVLLSGLLPLLFGITGFSMWWLKRAQRITIPGALVTQPAE